MSPEPSTRRVIQVHTRYRQSGGEDQVVAAEQRLLQEAGIEVEQVMFENATLRESRSPIGDLQLGLGAVWSRTAERRVRDAIRRFKPQVVHVHNTFAAASPSVYAAAAAEGVPVVQTLHNYRFACPAATAYRAGRPCTDCVGRFVPWPAVAHACVRDSKAQSLGAVATLVVHRALGTFSHQIGAYLALSEFQRALLVRGGLPEQRVRVLPNFLEPDPGTRDEPRSGILYVGRLTEEKGVRTLLRAAERVPGEIRVIGDGPLAAEVQASDAAGHLRYLGQLDRNSVLQEIRQAIALVVPSVWFEGFPMVVVESFAVGTPVIASRLGSLGELVEDDVTGVLVNPADADVLSSRVSWARDHTDALAQYGVNARLRYEDSYRGPAHLAALLKTYGEVADQPQNRPDV